MIVQSCFCDIDNSQNPCFLVFLIKVNDDEAFEMSRRLAKEEGILAGSSSGAALAAAFKLASEIESGNIVTVFPDRGDRYLSKGLFE